MMYPRPKRDFFGVAQDILIAHGVKKTGTIWETFAPKIETFLKQSHISPGSYNKRELDNIIRAAKETAEGTIPEMPPLDAPSEVAEDEPRTKPPSPVEIINLEEDEEEEFPEALRMRGGAPEEDIQDLFAEFTEAHAHELAPRYPPGLPLPPAPRDEIQPAVGAGGGGGTEASPEPEPETSPEPEPAAAAARDSEQAAREDQPAPEVPQSSVDQLHAQIQNQPAEEGAPSEVPLPESPSQSQGQFNPDFADDLATAESVTASEGTMEPGSDYDQFHDDATRSRRNTRRWPRWGERGRSYISSGGGNRRYVCKTKLHGYSSP